MWQGKGTQSCITEDTQLHHGRQLNMYSGQNNAILGLGQLLIHIQPANT